MTVPRKRIVFAPHDDGGRGFAVLWRSILALISAADEHDRALDVYCLTSSAALGGQQRLNELARGSSQPHRAVFVPTDNLIRLPKNPTTAALDGARIPEMLRASVRPRWREWPSEPDWLRSADERSVARLIPALWARVDLGISNGVAQLHRVAREHGF